MLWLTIFAFGMLAASMFLKNLMIYIGLCCPWLGILFWPDDSFPGYIKLCALAVIVFAVMSLKKLREGGV